MRCLLEHDALREAPIALEANPALEHVTGIHPIFSHHVKTINKIYMHNSSYVDRVEEGHC